MIDAQSFLGARAPAPRSFSEAGSRVLHSASRPMLPRTLCTVLTGLRSMCTSLPRHSDLARRSGTKAAATAGRVLSRLAGASRRMLCLPLANRASPEKCKFCETNPNQNFITPCHSKRTAKCVSLFQTKTNPKKAIQPLSFSPSRPFGPCPSTINEQTMTDCGLIPSSLRQCQSTSINLNQPLSWKKIDHPQPSKNPKMIGKSAKKHPKNPQRNPQILCNIKPPIKATESIRNSQSKLAQTGNFYVLSRALRQDLKLV